MLRYNYNVKLQLLCSHIVTVLRYSYCVVVNLQC